MSRNNNQTNNSLAPVHSSSSSSSSSSESGWSSRQPNITINVKVNISINYYSYGVAPPSQEQSLPTSSNLTGQQIKDLDKKDKKRGSSRRKLSSRSSRRSREKSFPKEVDALPINSEWDDLTDDDTQIETPKAPRTNKSKYSEEYQDLSTVQSEKEKRWRLSRNVKSVPEEELPKKKFHSDQQRREYVVLGRLNSLEPFDEKKEELTEEEKKKRSRELAKELY